MMTRGNHSQSKSKKREDLERQRDARRRRNVARKENQKENYIFYDDDDYKSFQNQLAVQGYQIKDVLGDGNCLFRALADQLNGDCSMHGKHRNEVVNFMRNHRDDFSPFLDETISFDKYLENLASDGTYGGNDSIVAFARLHEVDIVIHQLNSATFRVSGSNDQSVCQQHKIELHLAYHNMEHYSSVRAISDLCAGPGYMSLNEVKDEKNKQVHSLKYIPKNAKELRKKRKQELKEQKTLKIKDTNKEISNIERNGSVQMIQSETGFQDCRRIENALEDNNYDADETLLYILQLMTIEESTREEEHDFEGEVSQSAHKLNNPLHSSMASTDISKENNIGDDCHSAIVTLLEDILLQVCTDNEDIPANTSSANDITNNIKTKITNKNVTLKHTSSSKAKQEKIHQNSKNALRKNIRRNATQTNRPLSNRQRKELAKQERKKRRKEDKKESHEEENIMPRNILENVKCINI